METFFCIVEVNDITYILYGCRRFKVKYLTIEG